jgi:hypothetical protein
MPRKVADSSKHARAAALVDKLEGYPRDPDFRGELCPPAPFGSTLTEALPTPDASDPRVLVYLVADEVLEKLAESDLLSSSERAELSAIVAAATEVDSKGGLRAERS